VNKKWRGKNARNNFYRRTRIVRVKNVGEKIVGKSAKKTFLYSHEYHQNMGGNTRETIFPETNELCVQKIVGKKIVGKIAKQRFLYLHEYRDKKWGGKKRETIFTEEHE